MASKRGRFRRIRAGLAAHKRTVLGALLLMVVVSVSSLVVTQYLWFYINVIGFERIAVAALLLVAALLVGIEVRVRLARRRK